MKKVLLCIFLLIVTAELKAQSSLGGINYQAVARNTNGTTLSSQHLSIRFSILGGSASGNVQYQETQEVTTNQLGLFTAQIGKGTPVSGTFSGIPWSNANQYIKVEIAINGSNFSELGTSQLLSVPFAIYAANGGTVGPQGIKGDQGPAGPQGVKGDAGIIGPAGPIGPTGVKGDKGDIGAMGITGPIGAIGAAGPTGVKGDKGDIGAMGITGPIGPIGAAGPTGAKGDKGDVGATGVMGPIGPIGAAGPIGIKGDKGDIGATGVMGPIGPIGLVGPIGVKGDKGDIGATGVMGPIGPIGLVGPIGIKGDKGDIGATGAIGPIGPIGAAGPIGIKGDKGDIGATGVMGPIGPIGPVGPVGVKGDKGDIGATGVMGPIGPIGPVGPIGIKGDKGDIGATGVAGPTGPMGPAGPQGIPGIPGTVSGIAAGGDLSGTYPNPVVGNGKITLGKLAAGVIPTSLPPNGPAGGDLSGTYPDPKVIKIQSVPVSAVAPVNGQGLIFDGTNWTPTAATGDNLGNHTATKDIVLHGHKLANQTGGNAGIAISDSGAVSFNTIYTAFGSLRKQSIFSVDTAGGMFLLGETGAGNIPISGKGSRMMWYPNKSGFRVGNAETIEWDDSQIGLYSNALGHSVVASGYGTFVAGDQCVASATSAMSIGNGNNSSGTVSMSFGASCQSDGFASLAMGFTCAATGQASVAIGYRTTSSGDYSVALGYRASSNGHSGCMIMGDESVTDFVKNSADNQFVSRYAGGYTLYTKGTVGGVATTGAVLLPNASSWSMVSDSTKKENFEKADGENFLEKLRQLKLGSWNYKGTPVSEYRHYGAFAQEIFALFGNDKLGRIGCDTLINSGDMDGIMLIMLQALNKRCEALQTTNQQLSLQLTAITKLQEENRQLKTALADVHALALRLQELETSLLIKKKENDKTNETAQR
jgi:hypothetical protein